MVGWDKEKIPDWASQVSFSIQSLESFFAYVDRSVDDSPSGNIFNRLDFSIGRFNKVDAFLKIFDESTRKDLLNKGYAMAPKLVAEKRIAHQKYDDRLYEKQQEHEETVSWSLIFLSSASWTLNDFLLF